MVSRAASGCVIGGTNEFADEVAAGDSIANGKPKAWEGGHDDRG
jgi:hypothetical protein